MRKLSAYYNFTNPCNAASAQFLNARAQEVPEYHDVFVDEPVEQTQVHVRDVVVQKRVERKVRVSGCIRRREPPTVQSVPSARNRAVDSQVPVTRPHYNYHDDIQEVLIETTEGVVKYSEFLADPRNAGVK